MPDESISQHFVRPINIKLIQLLFSCFIVKAMIIVIDKGSFIFKITLFLFLFLFYFTAKTAD